MSLRATMTLLLLVAAAHAATAQTVWRCGADGRQFSDKPCAQGRTLEALEPRPAADIAAAQALAQRDKALAAQMVKERQQREAALAAASLRTARAEPIKPKAPEKKSEKAAPKRTAKHRHPADDGIWRAVVPSSRRTKG